MKKILMITALLMMPAVGCASSSHVPDDYIEYTETTYVYVPVKGKVIWLDSGWHSHGFHKHRHYGKHGGWHKHTNGRLYKKKYVKKKKVKRVKRKLVKKRHKHRVKGKSGFYVHSH